MANVHFKRDIVDARSILSHIIMNDLHNTEWFKIMPAKFKEMSKEEHDNYEVKVELFFDGEPIDVMKEFARLEKQLDEMVERAAIKLVQEQTSDKLRDVQSKIYDLEQIVNEMATDITWDSLYLGDGTQPFKK